jgi:hypothetical protein
MHHFPYLKKLFHLISGPSTNKKKKDKESTVPVKSSTSVYVNTENSPDSSKPVITEHFCACDDACNNCSKKHLKSCGPLNDLVKSGLSKDASKLCSCMCNKDKISVDKAGCGSGLSEGAVQGQKDPPARSLFSAITESSKGLKIPSDVSDMKCILAQNESLKFRSDEAVPASSATSSRSFSVPDLSEMVDGENAMFPDTISENCSESIDEEMNSENITPTNVEQDIECNESGKISKGVSKVLPTGQVEKNCDKNMASENSSHTEFEKMFKGMLDNGWSGKEGINLTIAELYLMFGEDGEVKFEYEWVNLREETALLQDKLLTNLNNMLRRLSHLAMIEFTDFTKVHVYML